MNNSMQGYCGYQLKIQIARTETNLEDRQLHVLGSGAHKRGLWKMPNAEAFMEVFVDCVECHYHVYKEGGVLHCHLTENNLMFEYGPDGDIRGVLHDWDVASDIDNDEKSPLSNATRRTGTIPFMARELLVDGIPPPHLYRHDLESFFYILVWAAINYNFGAAEPRKIDFTTARWDGPTLEDVKKIKQGFMTYHADLKKEILQRVHPKNSILLPWINSLRSLFFQAFVEHESVASNLKKSEDWDHATLGGYITFENFINAIGREPQG